MTSAIGKHRVGLFLIFVCTAISVFWGLAAGRSVPGRASDFQNYYYVTECLLHHCDPYNVGQIKAFYNTLGLKETNQPGEDQALSDRINQLNSYYRNLPTIFVFIAPFTIFSFGLAHALWTALTALCFILAAILMWDVGARYSPGVAALLVCILLANSELLFAGGNASGLVVSFCAIAVWCFLEERFVPVGILCLVVAMAIKPHDVGFVWLYFLFAGGAHRKRAILVLILVGALGLADFVWVSHLAPHWLPEMRANIAATAGPGGLNEPGPGSLTGDSPAMILDLQAVASVFWNNPRFYNLTSYFVCGIMLLLWIVTTLRSRFSVAKTWFALAAVIPVTILVTYHRPYDAKLLLLAVPACAMLWARGGPVAKTAVLLTTAGIALTGDIPLVISIVISDHLLPFTAGLPKLILTLLLTQPASLMLLILAIFYLYVYLKWFAVGRECGISQESDSSVSASLPPTPVEFPQKT